MRDRDTGYNPKDGHHSIDDVSRLSTSDLTSWLADFLVDTAGFPYGGGMNEESNVGHLSDIYKGFISDEAKLRFQEAVLANLTDLNQNHKSRLLGNAGDDLLLLVNDLFAGSQSTRSKDFLAQKTRENRLKATDSVLHILEDDRFLHISVKEGTSWGRKDGLIMRAGQTLVGLDYKGTTAFWESFIKKYGKDYGKITMWGLRLSGLRSAAKWLSKHLDNDEAVWTFMSEFAISRSKKDMRWAKEVLFPLFSNEQKQEFLKIEKNLQSKGFYLDK